MNENEFTVIIGLSNAKRLWVPERVEREKIDCFGGLLFRGCGAVTIIVSYYLNHQLLWTVVGQSDIS